MGEWVMKSFILVCLFCIFSWDLRACTGMKLVAKDGALVHGRTLEFGREVDLSVAVVPRGFRFKSQTAQGVGLSYKSRYAAVGAMAFGEMALLDGLNEKGLAVGTFYFPTFAKYAELTSENQARALSPTEFPHWILTQFATVEEVKGALEQIVVVSTPIKGWGSAPPPFHYIVYDKSGGCLVIEPIEGKLVMYENKLGVFTNSPSFDWHMTNLRNYIRLTPFNPAPALLGGVELAPLGQGAGMVGLPGDYTPPSRFVRAALFSTSATPAENSEGAVFQLFHLLNAFDIPEGVVKDKVGNTTFIEKTQVTCVRDTRSLKYYFRTYDDSSIQMVDLSKFDLSAKSIKTLNVTKEKSQANDLSSMLK